MAVDNSEWDGPAAMSRATQSDDPAAAYAAICAGRKEGDPELQSSWALPHHKDPGDPPNADGVRNALSRLSQTEGLTNRDAAQSHLENHLEDVQAAAQQSQDDPDVELAVPIHRTLDLDEPLQTLSVAQRKLGLRIVPYGVVADSKYGPLMFEQGAFGNVDAPRVRLRMDHEDPPTGLGTSFSEKSDGAYMDFKVSKTQRGDEQLTLAVDGVSRGASIGFEDVPGGPRVKTLDGRRVTVYPPNSAILAEVSTTWMPTFSEAGVTYVLHKEEKGTAPMGEAAEAPTNGAIDYAKLTEAIVAAGASNARDDKIDTMLEKFEQMVELQRASFKVPQGEAKKAKLHDWVGVTLRRMAGQQLSPTELKALALDDVITSDNPGLVPDQLTPDYDDLITSARPFLSSTREITPPTTGTSMILPLITTRAVAGTQYGGEKTDLTTTATKVGTGTFAYQGVFGGADVAIQMINRAEASFFDLLTGDLGEAYALDCEEKAIAALLSGYTDSASGSHQVNSGGAIDPTDPQFGVAWVNSITSGYKRAPTHIWMSAAAVGAFIDAKAPITNAPLYSNLAASFTAAGGAGGSLSGLTPIYVPALDTSGVDVIVGPARGFVWAEDPARTLQVDVPSKAGRDIALVGGIFPAPRYADAFTTYTVAS